MNNNFVSEILAFLRFRKKNSNNLRYYDCLLDCDYFFYVEDYFHDMLYMERKRAERFSRHFLLMVVGISSFSKENGDDKYISKIADVLSSCKRETDVAGWYEYDSIMGVIFTQAGEKDKESIREKVCRDLGNVLDPGQIKKIDITFHLFPEKGGESETIERKPDIILSPKKTRLRYSKKTSIFMKRVIDIVVSIVSIILVSPLFLIIPIVIRCTSEGAAFFTQRRVGQYGKEFTFLKFRTMKINNDDSDHKKYVADLINNNNGDKGKKKNGDKKNINKMKDDPRVTPVGDFLRKTSLDEIPQFINVLKGDMSLVGPRPPIPYEITNYNIWHKLRVRRVKPGITGVWQISGRSGTTFDEMVRMDIRYMREWTLLLDIKILLKTPYVVLTAKDAY